MVSFSRFAYRMVLIVIARKVLLDEAIQYLALDDGMLRRAALLAMTIANQLTEILEEPIISIFKQGI